MPLILKHVLHIPPTILFAHLLTFHRLFPNSMPLVLLFTQDALLPHLFAILVVFQGSS